MIIETIRSVLLADPNVEALLQDRVYPAAAPDGAARPHIVLSLAGGRQLVTQQGPGDLVGALVELAAVADRYRQAHELEAAAAAALRSAVADAEGLTAIPQSPPNDVPNIDEARTIHAVNRVWTVWHHT